MKSLKQIYLSLFLALALLLCGCTTPDETVSDASDANSSEERVAYTLEVLTEGGMPLAGVRVEVYSDNTGNSRLFARETDENGKLTFEALRSVELTAALSNLPAGLQTEQRFAITETTQIVLKASFEDGSDLSAFTMKLGSIARDCTVTATDGTEYRFSELLQTKKAIVLNFWFIGCGPCRAEFPHLQSAYDAYSEDVEVLAINPYDGTNASVAAYASEMGLTFPMIAGDAAWQSCMRLTAYPTTVVIDRYGMICMLFQGSITEEGVFERIFEHFSQNDYQQQIFRNPIDLLG